MVKLHPLKIHTSFFLAKNHPLYPNLPLITPLSPPLITPYYHHLNPQLPLIIHIYPKLPLFPNHHLSIIIHHYPRLPPPPPPPPQPFDQSPSNTSSTQHINRRQIQNTPQSGQPRLRRHSSASHATHKSGVRTNLKC